MTDCGTYRGFRAHERRGEQACDPCREARGEYMRRWVAQMSDARLARRREEHRRARQNLFGSLVPAEILDHPDRQCRDVDQARLWDGDYAELTELALAACQRCPVRIPCLEYALANGERGVWGGTTEHDREAIRRDAAGPETVRRHVRRVEGQPGERTVPRGRLNEDVIEALTSGRLVPYSRAERVEAVRRLRDRDVSIRNIAALLGLDHRQVTRDSADTRRQTREEESA